MNYKKVAFTALMILIVSTTLVAATSFIKPTGYRVLAEAEKQLEQEGKYFYIKQMFSSMINDSPSLQGDLYTEFIEDTQKGDYMVTETQPQWEIISKYAKIDGIEYYYNNGDPHKDLMKYFTEEELDELSMEEIDLRLVAAGLPPLFRETDPLYELSAEERAQLTDKEIEDRYSKAGGSAEESASFQQLLDLGVDAKRSSRLEMIRSLQNNPELEYLGEIKWEGQEVHAFKIQEENDQQYTQEAVFYFKVSDLSFAGLVSRSEYGGNVYENSTKVLESYYTDENPGLSSQGLKEIVVE